MRSDTLEFVCSCAALNYLAERAFQRVPHRRVFGADSQPTQDISLVTQGPHRDMLHLALSQTRHQRDVTQWDGWYLLPWASHCDLTLPAWKTDSFEYCRKSFSNCKNIYIYKYISVYFITLPIFSA